MTKTGQSISMDAMRVVEEHMEDGLHTTVVRDATLAEQVDAMQKDLLAQIVGMLPFAWSGDIAVQGEGGSAVVIVRLQGAGPTVVPEPVAPVDDATSDGGDAKPAAKKARPPTKKS